MSDRMLENTIIEAVQTSWTAETSYVPTEWNPQNPARGQCAVSALILQDFFDGDIRRYRATYMGQVETHFCNILNDGTELDVTREQYPQDVELTPAPPALNDRRTMRERILDDDGNFKKYHLLRDAVALKLGSEILRLTNKT